MALQTKSTQLKGLSLAMSIVASLFSQESVAFPKQKDVLQVISQIQSASKNVANQVAQQSQAVFEELSELTKAVSLLNAVVRSMHAPEKVVYDILNIDKVLHKLNDELKMAYRTHFRENIDDRTTFKHYCNEVFRFSVFATKLRQETGHYTMVESLGKPTQADLDVLIAMSNKRYGVND